MCGGGGGERMEPWSGEEGTEEVPEGVPGSGSCRSMVRTPGRLWAIKAQQARLGRWSGTWRGGAVTPAQGVCGGLGEH